MELKKYFSINTEDNKKPKEQKYIKLHLNKQITNKNKFEIENKNTYKFGSFIDNNRNNYKTFYGSNICSINLDFNTPKEFETNFDIVSNIKMKSISRKNSIRENNQNIQKIPNENNLYNSQSNFEHSFKNKDVTYTKLNQNINHKKNMNKKLNTISYINNNDVLCMDLRENMRNLRQKIADFKKIIENGKSKYMTEQNIIQKNSGKFSCYINRAKIINNDFSILNNINNSYNNLNSNIESFNNNKIKSNKKIKLNNLVKKENSKQIKYNFINNKGKNYYFNPSYKNEKIEIIDNDDLSDIARELMNYKKNNNNNLKIKETNKYKYNGNYKKVSIKNYYENNKNKEKESNFELNKDINKNKNYKINEGNFVVENVLSYSYVNNKYNFNYNIKNKEKLNKNSIENINILTSNNKANKSEIYKNNSMKIQNILKNNSILKFDNNESIKNKNKINKQKLIKYILQSKISNLINNDESIKIDKIEKIDKTYKKEIKKDEGDDVINCLVAQISENTLPKVNKNKEKQNKKNKKSSKKVSFAEDETVFIYYNQKNKVMYLQVYNYKNKQIPFHQKDMTKYFKLLKSNKILNKKNNCSKLDLSRNEWVNKIANIKKRKNMSQKKNTKSFDFTRNNYKKYFFHGKERISPIKNITPIKSRNPFY